MRITILGAAGFIGTNLALKLAENKEDTIVCVDKNQAYFANIQKGGHTNIEYVEASLDSTMNFDEVCHNTDILYHLVTYTIPATSNRNINEELESNIIFTTSLLESCVKEKVGKVVFISSGGTVYGKEVCCPIKEDDSTNPISSYGVQKLLIEKILYLYNHLYGLDYCVVRPSNPYGPYQRPNSGLGAVTTFIYKAINHEKITVFGDGSVVRDFIYIDDAIEAIVSVANSKTKDKIFNIGSSKGTSIKHLLEMISSALDMELDIEYKEGRKADVMENYLDMSRYFEQIGQLEFTDLKDGIRKTAEFLKK